MVSMMKRVRVTVEGLNWNGIVYDVREFIRPETEMIVRLISKLFDDDIDKCSFEERVATCYRWVLENIKYMDDSNHILLYSRRRFGRWHVEKPREFFGFPEFTLMKGMGDCDCQSILLVSMIRACEIAPRDVFMAVGHVKIDEKDIGHAWVVVKRPLGWKDRRWYIFDPTLEKWDERWRPVPSFFMPQIMFNDREVRIVDEKIIKSRELENGRVSIDASKLGIFSKVNSSKREYRELIAEQVMRIGGVKFRKLTFKR